MNSKSTTGRVIIHALDVLLFLLLGVSSVLGFANAYSDFKLATKFWEFFCCSVISTYSVTGAIALVGLLKKRRWALWFMILWGLAMTISAGAATVVYGEETWAVGLVASASVLLVVVPAIYWAVKKLNRA